MSARAHPRGRGAAVVLAMLLAAFAAVVAATVFADQERWSRNVLQRRDQVQGAAIALAGLQWARQILYDDARSSTVDHLGEPWALTLPPIPLDNGEVRGTIIDAQGRLNINALADSGADSAIERARLARLFTQRGGPVSALDALADWVDPDQVARPAGAEDGWYAAQAVPMLAANAPLLRVAEAAAVRNVSPEALAAVRPFLTALPERTSVNVNTAPVEVLAAVLDDASPEALVALMATRKHRPFADVADFRSRLPAGARLASEQGLDVKSRFFEVTVEARQGSTVTRGRALVRRESDRWPVVVWQVIE